MIRIVQGNDVNIHVPLMEKNADGTTSPIDFANVSGLEVHLSIGSEAFNDFTIYTANNTVVICLNENAPVGAYSILITAKNNGVDICYNEKCAFAIVTYNGDSTYIDYIADEDVTLDTALFVAAIVNDQQVEELRQELRQKISEAEQAKDEYDAAAENLVDVAEDLGDISQTVEDAVEDAMQGADVAKQGTDPTVTLTIIKGLLDNLDLTNVAKQGTDPTATLTAIKSALDNMDISNVAKQGSNSNATNTAILSAINNIDVSALATEANATTNKNAILNDIAAKASAILGTDTTATLTAIKTAIAGLSIPTVQQIQSGLAKTSELPTDYAKQGANTSATLSDTQGAVKNGTTTALAELLNNTYGLQALETLVSAIAGYALQGSDSTATNTAIKSAIATLATAVGAIPTNPATGTDVSGAKSDLQGSDTTATLTSLKTQIGNINIPASVASESSVKDGNDTAISMLKDGTFGLSAIKTLVQAISGYALQGSDPTATNTAIKQTILDNVGTPQMTIPNTTATQELAPNTVYLFESRTNNLTLTLGTPIAGQNNEYHFFVFVGATVPSITYPAGISWNGGSAPTITANKNYEISINNNIAAYFEI